MYPELSDIGTSESDIQALERALIEAWDIIPSKIFQACIDSILDRVIVVITAEG